MLKDELPNPSGMQDLAYSLSALREIGWRIYGPAAIRVIRSTKRIAALPGAGNCPAPRPAKSSAVLTPAAVQVAEAARLRSQLRETCKELDRQRELIAAETTRLRMLDISRSLETTNTPM